MIFMIKTDIDVAYFGWYEQRGPRIIIQRYQIQRHKILIILKKKKKKKKKKKTPGQQPSLGKICYKKQPGSKFHG